MFLSVQELERKAIRFDVSFRPGEIDFEGTRVRQTGPIRTDGMAELLSNTLGEIRVRGSLAGELEAECDRCLDPVRTTISSGYDLFYRPLDTVSGAGEREIDDGESQVAFYTGDGLDLGDVLREHLLLSLPMQQICSEGCQGICPRCGANRNAGSCGCGERPVDDRWAALRELKL